MADDEAEEAQEARDAAAATTQRSVKGPFKSPGARSWTKEQKEMVKEFADQNQRELLRARKDERNPEKALERRRKRSPLYDRDYETRA